MEATEQTGKNLTKKQMNSLNPILNRVLPNSQDLENAILGAIMIESKTGASAAFDIVRDYLKPECFYQDRNRLIFSAMVDLNKSGNSMDTLSVINELLRKKQLEKIGGAYEITKITDGIVSSVNVESHCKMIFQKYLAREYINMGGTMSNEGYDSIRDIFEMIEETSTKLYNLQLNNLRSSYYSVDSLLVDVLKETETLRHRKEDVTGVPTGYKIMDVITGGWQPSDLVIIAARPSVGKTAFALNLARNAATGTKKTAVGFFSLEMSRGQLTKRLQSTESKIDLDKIIKARVNDSEMALLHEASGKISEMKIFIDDTSGINLYELRAKARRMVDKDGVGIIFIDYLQLMSGDGNNHVREQEISSISRGLKALAKDLNVPIIALSQLSRDIEKRSPPKPKLSDLRESGAIEQDADIVIFLSRTDYQKESGEVDPDISDEAEVKFAKNRNGALVTIPFFSVSRIVSWMDQRQYDKYKALLDLPKSNRQWTQVHVDI